MSNFKKALYFIVILLGCLFIVSAFISIEISLWERIRDICIGLSLFAFATIHIVRLGVLFVFTLLLGISCVFQIIDDTGSIDFTGVFFTAAIFGISVYLGFKFVKQVKGIRGSDDFTLNDDVTITTHDEFLSFFSSHDIIDEINTKVVGVSFDNDDGTSRQDILSRCTVGDQVYFRYYVYRGTPAYSVTTDHGQIGNLPAELSHTIDQQYDGCTLYGTITKISGGEDGFYYGCNLQILVFREKQDHTISRSESQAIGAIPTKTPAVASAQNIIYPTLQKRKKSKPSDVDSSFIAEAQWYASHGGSSSDEAE